MDTIESEKSRFIENMGLIFERSGVSKTLGRVFGCLLLAQRPKTLDEIAADLFFSKATASLTVRQGLALRLFEKVSMPGERKDLYRLRTISWINAMTDKINTLSEWETLVGQGFSLIDKSNRPALENLSAMKDYLDFLRWYLGDFEEQYGRWKKGQIIKNTAKEIRHE
ncbi:HTH-type transcriptional repressor OpcR [Pelotomaculum schinkii]|uniref:HTH-type transcriptional repressor OpcR n=1 Tax=Pelotomaculum schinkii TaxID=78350 RepID=A0A4Y7R5S2_9FIRM|nr:hypothetical protein [Pelotomaculum schinkii]TEB04069.1 HTH-type transcriptional repressor OpcR [Pelotomaculum schinkii]